MLVAVRWSVELISAAEPSRFQAGLYNCQAEARSCCIVGHPLLRHRGPLRKDGGMSFRTRQVRARRCIGEKHQLGAPANKLESYPHAPHGLINGNQGHTGRCQGPTALFGRIVRTASQPEHIMASE